MKKDNVSLLRKHLVRLLDIDDEFTIELRYATPDNFTGRRIYDFSECYIHAETAQLLIKAKNVFKKDGFGLKVWDAYRPIRAQKALWDFLPDDNFVARPPDPSGAYPLRPTHMNGMCVDITLLDEEGREVFMPTPFDHFSEEANPLSGRAPREALENALYLRKVMLEQGFSPSNTEWWHFFDRSSKPVAFSDFSF